MTRTRLLAVQWHYGGADERLTVAEEARESHAGDDGTWLQHTISAENRPHPVPDQLLFELKRWRRFLKKHHLTDVQIRYLHRRVHLFGPPPRYMVLAPEWSLFSSVPSFHMGSGVFSYTCRARRMPTKRLMQHLHLLLQAPHLKAEKKWPGPVLFEGDLLTGFLESALDHILSAGEKLGRWQHVGPKFPATPQNPVSVGLLPGSERFLPAVTHPKPAGCWSALAYDGSGLLLHRGGAYRLVELDEPLYRLFPDFRFTDRYSGLTLKDHHYIMPAAIYFPRA